ncbi:TPA: hypothetical protein L3M66_004786 [Vibrio parahaemolyticus]|nr:hypothetical protein [Vibrio parahaemolyticus]
MKGTFDPVKSWKTELINTEIFTVDAPRTNAALRGEQRIPPKLNHCAVNTKAD